MRMLWHAEIYDLLGVAWLRNEKKMKSDSVVGGVVRGGLDWTGCNGCHADSRSHDHPLSAFPWTWTRATEEDAAPVLHVVPPVSERHERATGGRERTRRAEE